MQVGDQRLWQVAGGGRRMGSGVVPDGVIGNSMLANELWCPPRNLIHETVSGVHVHLRSVLVNLIFFATGEPSGRSSETPSAHRRRQSQTCRRSLSVEIEA